MTDMKPQVRRARIRPTIKYLLVALLVSGQAAIAIKTTCIHRETQARREELEELETGSNWDLLDQFGMEGFIFQCPNFEDSCESLPNGKFVSMNWRGTPAVRQEWQRAAHLLNEFGFITMSGGDPNHPLTLVVESNGLVLGHTMTRSSGSNNRTETYDTTAVPPLLPSRSK